MTNRGLWVRGLICCFFYNGDRQRLAFRWTRIDKIREVDDAIYFKPVNESVYIFFTFSISPEIEVKGEEETGSFEESHIKDKFDLVIKRVAKKEGQTGNPLLLTMGSKLSGEVEEPSTPRTMERTLSQ